MYLPHPYVKTRPDPKVWGVKKFTDRYIKIYAKTLPGEGFEKGKKAKKRKSEKSEKKKKKEKEKPKKSQKIKKKQFYS